MGFIKGTLPEDVYLQVLVKSDFQLLCTQTLGLDLMACVLKNNPEQVCEVRLQVGACNVMLLLMLLDVKKSSEFVLMLTRRLACSWSLRTISTSRSCFLRASSTWQISETYFVCIYQSTHQIIQSTLYRAQRFKSMHLSALYYLAGEFGATLAMGG